MLYDVFRQLILPETEKQFINLGAECETHFVRRLYVVHVE